MIPGVRDPPRRPWRAAAPDRVLWGEAGVALRAILAAAPWTRSGLPGGGYRPLTPGDPFRRFGVEQLHFQDVDLGPGGGHLDPGGGKLPHDGGPRIQGVWLIQRNVGSGNEPSPSAFAAPASGCGKTTVTCAVLQGPGKTGAGSRWP